MMKTWLGFRSPTICDTFISTIVSKVIYQSKNVYKFGGLAMGLKFQCHNCLMDCIL